MKYNMQLIIENSNIHGSISRVTRGTSLPKMPLETDPRNNSDFFFMWPYKSYASLSNNSVLIFFIILSSIAQNQNENPVKKTI